MQANHKEEINFMQHYLMDIKEKNNKMIKDMEEHHVRQINAIKVEHSSQIDAIKIQVQKFQQWSEDERNQGTSIVRSLLICCNKLHLIMRRSLV